MYDKNNRSLFEKEGYQPLADRIRPNDFDNIYGQTHIIGEKKILSEIIKQDNIKCLRISDFNTTGLVGIDSTDINDNQYLCLGKNYLVDNRVKCIKLSLKGI